MDFVPSVGTLRVAAGVALVLLILAFGLTANAAHRRSTSGLRKQALGTGVKVPFAMRFAWYKRHAGWKALWLAPLSALGLPAVAGAAYILPLNDVWGGGVPREWCHVDLKVLTATSLRSGRLLERDTTDEQVKLAATGSEVVLAVMGTRNWSNPEWDHTTAPAVGDIIECFYAIPGAILKVRCEEDLLAGALVEAGALGIQALAVDAEGRFGRLLRDVDGTPESDALVVVG